MKEQKDAEVFTTPKGGGGPEKNFGGGARRVGQEKTQGNSTDRGVTRCTTKKRGGFQQPQLVYK